MNILNSTSSSAKHAQRSKVRNKINILKYLYTHISMYHRIVSPNGLARLTFEVTSNRKVQIPLYCLKILTFF